MDELQRNRLVESLNRTANEISAEPGFMDSAELKAAYMVTHTLTASVLFGVLEDLADRCSGFCEEKASMPPPGPSDQLDRLD